MAEWTQDGPRPGELYLRAQVDLCCVFEQEGGRMMVWVEVRQRAFDMNSMRRDLWWKRVGPDEYPAPFTPKEGHDG